MTNETLSEFNKALKALLEKYNVTLTIGQQIVVNDKPVEEIKITDVEAKTTSETTGTE